MASDRSSSPPSTASPTLTLFSASTIDAADSAAKLSETSSQPSVRSHSRSRFWCLLMVHIGAALALFLATTDATVVSTSLPTIAADLSASTNRYSWIGVSYMLTQTACQPLYPVFSRITGRKAVLFVSIVIFISGSALCGSAQTVVWLIAARSVQGIGAGGIVNSVWVLTSDIVTPEEKNKWSQALSLTWSASAIAGPLLGGVFSQHSNFFSWRWAFYMNVPVGLIALLMLSWSLRYFELEKTSEFTWNTLRTEFIRDFDYIGVSLLVMGTACTVLGFSFAAQLAWSAPLAMALLLIGATMLLLGVVYEARTTRVAILPKALFRSRTEIIILIISFLHNVAFNAGTFYLALYFQAALGASPLLCGVLMLPYSLGSAVASIPIALFNDYYSKKTKDTCCYKYAMFCGLSLSTIGFGLLTMLNDKSNVAIRELYPLIAGVGVGMLFHAPFAALTNGMSIQERSRTTSAFFLVRFIGATAGLSIAGAVYESRIAATMTARSAIYLSGGSVDLRGLVHILPLSLRAEVLRIVSNAISWIWIVCVCCLGISCLISLGIRVVPIEKSDDTTTEPLTA